MNQEIIACEKRVGIGSPVVLWDEYGGYACPNPRGRKNCSQHDPGLNDAPTRPSNAYRISDPLRAYDELKQSVYQLVLHYDVCFCSYQCHQLLAESSYKGSHFYLDLDGTIYQTCDLYWKTNTAPADDRMGNERSVHVEMANLSWEALGARSEIYQFATDQYQRVNGRWELKIPENFRKKIRTPGFRAAPSRSYGKRGYFSRRINGTVVRMWDYTEEQYQALIRLCFGINQLLPRIKLRVPFDKSSGRVPLDRIRNFSTFAGVLGHAHVQAGGRSGVETKHDPGSAFNWSRLRKAFDSNSQDLPVGRSGKK